MLCLSTGSEEHVGNIQQFRVDWEGAPEELLVIINLQTSWGVKSFIMRAVKLQLIITDSFTVTVVPQKEPFPNFLLPFVFRFAKKNH